MSSSAEELLRQAFPHGWKKIDVSAFEFWCGPRAVKLAMKKQHPSIPTATVGNFRTIVASDKWKESMNILGLNRNNQNKFYVDQLATMVWMYGRSLDLDTDLTVGCIIEQRNGPPEYIVVPVENKHDRPVTIMWIHNDNAAEIYRTAKVPLVSHYMALESVEAYETHGPNWIPHYKKREPMDAQTENTKARKRSLPSDESEVSQSQPTAPIEARKYLPIRGSRIAPKIQWPENIPQSFSSDSRAAPTEVIKPPPRKRPRYTKRMQEGPKQDDHLGQANLQDLVYEIVRNGLKYTVPKFKKWTLLDFLKGNIQLSYVRVIITLIRQANANHPYLDRPTIEAIFTEILWNAWRRWKDRVYVYCPKYPFMRMHSDYYKRSALHKALDQMLSEEAEEYWYQQGREHKGLNITSDRQPVYPQDEPLGSPMEIMHRFRTRIDRLLHTPLYTDGYPKLKTSELKVLKMKANMEDEKEDEEFVEDEELVEIPENQAQEEQDRWAEDHWGYDSRYHEAPDPSWEDDDKTRDGETEEEWVERCCGDFKQWLKRPDAERAEEEDQKDVDQDGGDDSMDNEEDGEELARLCAELEMRDVEYTEDEENNGGQGQGDGEDTEIGDF